MLIFIDIDGVLADCTHRLHFLKEKNYDEFYSDENVLKDKKIEKGVALVHQLRSNTANEIIFLSSRNARTKDATITQLSQFLEAPRDWVEERLDLRGRGDYRPSWEVKIDRIHQRMDTLLVPFVFIDDDPDNVREVMKQYPSCIGLVFGTNRIPLQSP